MGTAEQDLALSAEIQEQRHRSFPNVGGLEPVSYSSPPPDSVEGERTATVSTD